MPRDFGTTNGIESADNKTGLCGVFVRATHTNEPKTASRDRQAPIGLLVMCVAVVVLLMFGAGFSMERDPVVGNFRSRFQHFTC